MKLNQVVLGILLGGPAWAGAPTQVEVFRAGVDGYHTYRIPAVAGPLYRPTNIGEVQAIIPSACISHMPNSVQHARAPRSAAWRTIARPRRRLPCAEQPVRHASVRYRVMRSLLRMRAFAEGRTGRP